MKTIIIFLAIVLIGCSENAPVGNKTVAQSTNSCSSKIIITTNTHTDTLIFKYANYENQVLWFEELGKDYNILEVQSFRIIPNY